MTDFDVAVDPLWEFALADWLEENGDPLAAQQRSCAEARWSTGIRFVPIPGLPICMGVYTVTQAEYEKVMGENPSWFSADGGGKARVKGMDTSKFPVEQVNCHDAVKFCEKLSLQRSCRLPTEAEWEYACRAGTTTEYHDGDEEDDLDKVGWYYANSDSRTHEVGTKKANAWGLHDMHGNVWEWTGSPWEGEHSSDPTPSVSCAAVPGTARASIVAPLVSTGTFRAAAATASASGSSCRLPERRVLRGGAWHSDAAYCRSACRSSNDPGNRSTYIGFRVALLPA